MSIQDAIAAELPFLQAQAESRMTSRANVRRLTARQSYTEDSVRENETWTVVHAAVPFRLKHGRSRTVTIGGVEFEEATAEGHLPADVTDLADGDLIEVLSGEWPGTVWRVVEAIKGDQMTARRVPVVEQGKPTRGWV